MSGIAKLAPYLTEANREMLLARAAEKSKREIEELVVELSPKPDVPATGVWLGRAWQPRSSTPEIVPERRKPEPARVQLSAVSQLGCQSEVASDGGPVHGQRRAPRQAGATPLPHALIILSRSRQRPGARRPSPRSSRDSKPSALRRREPPERASNKPTRRHRQGTSPPRSNARFVSAMATSAPL